MKANHEYFMVVLVAEANSPNKVNRTWRKSIKDSARKWTHDLCSILFEVIRAFGEMIMGQHWLVIITHILTSLLYGLLYGPQGGSVVCCDAAIWHIFRLQNA